MKDLRITLPAPTNYGAYNATDDALEAAVRGWNALAAALASIAGHHATREA